MERKVYEAQVKQFSGEGMGAAVLARLGVRDKDGDVLVPGLLGGEQQAPLIQAHDWQIPAFGRAVVRERGDELVADFALNLGTARGREWASVLKFDLERGPLQQWSWGFTIPPDGAEMGTHQGERVRFLRRIQLLEVSPVVVGASVGSRTLALKADQDLAAQTTAAAAAGLALLARKLPAPPAPPAPRFAYKFVPIPSGDWRHAMVRDYFWKACREVSISQPPALFFEEAGTGEADFSYSCKVSGMAFHGPRRIGIHVNVGPQEFLEVLAHEAGHLAGKGEAESRQFGEQFAATVLGEASRWTWEQWRAAVMYAKHQGASVREIAEALAR